MFNIQNVPVDSPIYCFIGDPFNKSSEFGYVKLASAAFYGAYVLQYFFNNIHVVIIIDIARHCLMCIFS